MNRYDQTFEWQQFPEGRACFSGGIRGWDERGYDTFAVESDGQVVYGEIVRIFLPNHNVRRRLTCAAFCTNIWYR